MPAPAGIANIRKRENIMGLTRAWHSLRLLMIGSATKRGDYARKHKLFHYCGKNVGLPRRVLPLHPELISIHDNVMIGSGTILTVHDAVHTVLNRAELSDGKFEEYVGCIEIMENTFIGANTIVLGGVRIGPNAIVGAMSLVNKDVAPGTVVGGVPAKPISTFDKMVEKRAAFRKMSAAERWAEFEKEKSTK